MRATIDSAPDGRSRHQTMDTMTTQERFQAVMNFEPFDRLPLWEWAGWWDETTDRWHKEGLSPHLTDRYDICRHFGWFQKVVV
ncbi:MAG: hypothetical protein DDT33_00675 [Firmicutes bacterium]|nr:hypothetical protein [Bacillota bacterium]